MQTEHVLSGADFSMRLHSALKAHGCPVTPTEFSRRFNSFAGDRSVTVHGARKWLVGESVPHQARLILLASWLKVSPHWLRYGDEVDFVTRSSKTSALTIRDQKLLDDFQRLTPDAQQVVEELLASLLKRRTMRS